MESHFSRWRQAVGGLLSRPPGSETRRDSGERRDSARGLLSSVPLGFQGSGLRESVSLVAVCTSELPVVLVGADALGLLAILGGLLDRVHDLGVLLRERHNPAI